MTELTYPTGTLTEAMNKAVDVGIVEDGQVMDLEDLIEHIASRFGFDRDELIGTFNQAGEHADKPFSIAIDKAGIPPSSPLGLSLRRVVAECVVSTGTKIFLAALLLKDQTPDGSR